MGSIVLIDADELSQRPSSRISALTHITHVPEGALIQAIPLFKAHLISGIRDKIVGVIRKKSREHDGTPKVENVNYRLSKALRGYPKEQPRSFYL